MSVVQFLTTSLGAVVIICMWSMVFHRESILSRWVEVSVVGVGVGYLVASAMRSVYTQCITPILKGQYIFIVPLVLGILTVLQFYPRFRWIVRWPMAVLVALQLAIGVRGSVSAYFWLQVLAQVEEFRKAVSIFDFTNVVIQVAAVILTLIYFTYSLSYKGVAGNLPKMGRYVMMVGFGVMFTFALVTRASWLMSAIRYLLHDWLGLIV